jgi:hypothetical protein
MRPAPHFSQPLARLESTYCKTHVLLPGLMLHSILSLPSQGAASGDTEEMMDVTTYLEWDRQIQWRCYMSTQWETFRACASILSLPGHRAGPPPG